MALLASPATSILHTQRLAPSGGGANYFGTDIAIDGDRAIIGAQGWGGSGAAYIYDRGDAGIWAQRARLVASDPARLDWFGSAVDVSGDLALVGAFNHDDAGTDSGAAYVFERSIGWQQVQKLVPSDLHPHARFGSEVLLDGDSLLVGAAHHDGGAYTSGKVYQFNRDASGTWVETAQLLPPDPAAYLRFGFNLEIEGDRLFVAAPGGGNAAISGTYVFERSGASWVFSTKITPASLGLTGHLGGTLAADGDRLVIGGAGPAQATLGTAESVAVVRANGTGWQLEALLRAPIGQGGDLFGWGLGMDADIIVVGAPGRGVLGNSYDGATFWYVHDGDAWSHGTPVVPYDKSPTEYNPFNLEPLDMYGSSIAMEDGVALIGAPTDRNYAGSTYAYNLGSCPPALPC